MPDLLSFVQFELLLLITFFVVLDLIVFNIIFFPRFSQTNSAAKPNKKLLGKEVTYKKFYKALLIFNDSISLIFITLSIYSLFFSYPKMVHTYPEWDSYWRDYDRPIEVEFNRPIDTKTLVLNISPETEGRWEFKKDIQFLPFVRTVKFYPEETVFPGNKVIVYFTHVTNFFNNHDNREEFIQFNSVDLPTILRTSPDNNAKEVQTTQEIVLYLSHKDGEYVDWEVSLEGKDDKFTLERNDSEEIKIKFEEPLKQNEIYNLKISQIPIAVSTFTGETSKKDNPIPIHSFSFSTVKVPLVAGMSPQGLNVLTNTPIKVSFDSEMDQESVAGAFVLNPSAEGDITWQDTNTFIFNPKGLQKETKYNVSFKKGLMSKNGGLIQSDIAYSFTTIGTVKVVGWSPSNGSSKTATNTLIKVTFDQDVDRASAQAAFSFSPQVDGTFNWSGNNVMTYDPNVELNQQTTFTAKVNAGIKALYGLDSSADYSTTFTTEAKKVLLSMKLYTQVNSKECQIVATQMLLGFKGVYKSSSQIFSEIPKQTVVCDATNNIWGDPNLGFMGEIDGNHDCASGHRGYGIYWNPISNYLAANGVTNIIKRGMSVTDLTREVEAGHPIMLWWQNGWSTPTNVSWKTPEGKEIYAINGTHSEIVVGFVGSSDNPTHIITNDPWRGQRTLEVGYFKSLWAYHNNTGIIVY